MSIAERLIGLDLFRMKREDKLLFKKRNNKNYAYLGKNRISFEDLAAKTGFSKPILCNTLRKLKV